MACGKPLDSEVDAAVVSLVDIAVKETLVICAGAGISGGAGLPDGKELARRLHARFSGQVSGYSCDEPESLLTVAEAAATVRGGLEAVQRIVLQVAPFASATPQPAHLMLGLLVAEGTVRLLLTNWDDCVERSWRQREHLAAARNAAEAEALRGQVILKMHGCCTQVQTILITPSQLESPGLWAQTRFEAELANSTMVFVGVGDIAGYAQKRITQLAELVEHARVRVVSPNIDRSWEDSAWKDVLPDLPTERRLPRTAEEFFDELAREWVMTLVRSVCNEAPDTLAPWMNRTRAAFVKFTATEALIWLRNAAAGWDVGESVVHHAAAATALEAIAILASQQAMGSALVTTPGDGLAENVGTAIRFVRNPAVLIDDQRVEVLLCKPRLVSSAVEALALERARTVAVRLGPQREVTVLCSAASMRGPARDHLDAADVVDPDAAIDDQIDGARQVAVKLVFADDLLRAA